MIKEENEVTEDSEDNLEEIAEKKSSASKMRTK